ncbi:unknown protein [Seminavis robusta]|uniref:Uncharacterized protein n=1 Tax=Seminavis robusta TaxID=568900 RepID=A0A9N8HDM3_9STRA|nr:unknown protein [Seminavis robusta]|eukprot:Sro368_g127931.1  (235) ;mRNA; r:23559-24263
MILYHSHQDAVVQLTCSTFPKITAPNTYFLNSIRFPPMRQVGACAGTRIIMPKKITPKIPTERIQPLSMKELAPSSLVPYYDGIVLASKTVTKQLEPKTSHDGENDKINRGWQQQDQNTRRWGLRDGGNALRATRDGPIILCSTGTCSYRRQKKALLNLQPRCRGSQIKEATTKSGLQCCALPAPSVVVAKLGLSPRLISESLHLVFCLSIRGRIPKKGTKKMRLLYSSYGSNF